MTIALERPQTAATSTAAREEVEWVETDVVHPPVWIGRYKGVYLGMIEHRSPEGYTSTTHRGRSLGNFATLDEAQRAFYA